MRDIRLTPTVRRAALISVLLTMAGAGCSEDSTVPPPVGDGATTSAAVLDKHRLTANGKALVGPSDERIPIDQKQVIGYVDAATPNGNYVDLHGWVARADFSAPADAVVAVAGKKSVAVTPTIDRPDVADGYDKPALENSGFGISVPRSALNCSAPSQGLKTFAVTDSAAAPLKWLGEVGRVIRNACRG